MTDSAAVADQTASTLHHVFLGLGSNIANRDAHLADALRALDSLVTIERVSSVYDTAPMDYTDQPRFHNLAVQGTTTLSPLDLLHGVKAIERALGRAPGLRYGPRVIDIDLLFYDQLVLRADELILPHPRLPERAFVLAPLAEIAPALIHPELGESILDLLRRVAGSDVRRLGPLPDSER